MKYKIGDIMNVKIEDYRKKREVFTVKLRELYRLSQWFIGFNEEHKNESSLNKWMKIKEELIELTEEFGVSDKAI